MLSALRTALFCLRAMPLFVGVICSAPLLSLRDEHPLRDSAADPAPDRVEIVTPVRARMPLDGTWRFQPAGMSPPATGSAWGSIQVPGDWAGGSSGITRGSGGAWGRFDPDHLSAAWYEKTVTVPGDWTDRAILLDLQRVSTDAIVFIDGRRAGEVRWPAGTVDLTGAMRPGRTAQLRMLVISSPDAAVADSALKSNGQRLPGGSGTLKTRGVIGSVALESRPRGAAIGDVAISTSTRRKELGLAIGVDGHLGVGALDVTAKLLDETGREEREFTAHVDTTAADRQDLHVTFPWPNPRLWDIGKPNLYTLLLTVQGQGLNDTVRQTFGFREFWVQGRRFYLNGVPIRLRPDTSQEIEAQREAGFNFTEVWPDDPDERGTPSPDDAWFERADRAGWLTTGRLASLVPYIVDRNHNVIWNDARKQAWTARVEAEIRRARNHPSIVIWGHSPNFFGNPQDQNPRVIGRRDAGRRAAALPAYQAGLEGCDIVRSLDPTRPVYTHGGADVGDVFTVSHYLNLIPLQEREDWMTDWVKSGDMPYMGVEFGTPIYTTFLRGRMDYERATTTEPLVTEFAAIYLGHQAYLDETDAYRANYQSRFDSGQTYRFELGRDRSPIIDSPAFQKVEALFNRNTWRSWRTTGVTGGMAPRESHGQANSGLTESGRSLTENNGPTLAWITGPWDAPTAKTHSYHVDETVEKQVALLNDSRQTLPYQYSWRAWINGKPLTAGGGRGQIRPSETLFKPLRFATPYFRSGRAEGQIVLSTRIGTAQHEDKFEYRVFSRRTRRDRPPSLPVFDPTGRTGDILPVVDFVPRQWRGERNVPIVIVGQNALSSGRRVPGDLEAYVRGGGRVLLFAQNPEWIEKSLGMRTAAYLARRVFPVSESHPMMRGLDSMDLRDWRGASTLLPARPVYAGKAPETGWHWGNRGVVSSVSIEKPHMSSWRPLLEDEFDLAYSPLMEMEYGRGRIVWCSLDLEDHAITDAAAERVFDRVLIYALHAPLTPKAERVLFVGSRSESAYLTSLGVQFRDAAVGSVSSSLLFGTEGPQLLLLGSAASIDPADLARYVQQGGRVLFLHRDRTAAGFGPAVAAAPRHGSLAVPDWYECRGLSVSDLHGRADGNVLILQSIPNLEAGGLHGVATIGADGLLGRLKLGRGVALFCQLDPEALDADAKTYLRLTRWRQTHALCLLLSNLGASFRQDERIFHAVGAESAAPGFYYPDYRSDFELGDNPYRYFRW